MSVVKTKQLENRLNEFQNAEYVNNQRKKNLSEGYPINHGFPSTKEEHNLLNKMFLSNPNLSHLSDFFGRSEHSVKLRLISLGLIEEDKVDQKADLDSSKSSRPKKYFPNGDFYEGELKDGIQHGQGKYIWANGNIYEGEWSNGKRHGFGLLTLANGSKYEGNWINDKRPMDYNFIQDERKVINSENEVNHTFQSLKTKKVENSQVYQK